MNSNSQPSPKRRFLRLIPLGILGICMIIAAQFIPPLPRGDKTATATPEATLTISPVPAPSLKHFIGGFAIKSNAEIANAVMNGVQATLIYGYTPDETDSVGEALKANNMKVIDTMPWTYLYYYECHLHKTCSSTIYPELTSPQAVLSNLTVHLKQVQNNSLVIGYWTLDDWPYKAGSGKDLLVQMNKLIHQYTPGKPTICGFGGGIPPLPRTTFQWNDGTAANFSPEGCDMVGLYIYGQSDTTGAYDWSMTHILPAVFTSLKKRGWSISQQPLVGIPQVFGGTVNDQTWPIPNASDVERQTKTYCQQGATGILYYNWGETGKSPMNSPQINQGMKSGIAHCKSIWK